MWNCFISFELNLFIYFICALLRLYLLSSLFITVELIFLVVIVNHSCTLFCYMAVPKIEVAVISVMYELLLQICCITSNYLYLAMRKSLVYWMIGSNY